MPILLKIELPGNLQAVYDEMKADFEHEKGKRVTHDVFVSALACVPLRIHAIDHPPKTSSEPPKDLFR